MGAESVKRYVADPNKSFEKNVDDVLRNLAVRITELENRQQELSTQFDETESRNRGESCMTTEHVGRQPFPFDKWEQKEFRIAEVQGGANPGLRGVVEDIETFVDIRDPSNYTAGEVIMVEITDLDENAAYAIPADEMEV